ncbi:hypothetical protein AVEN_130351-1 [Araneus ventricosus]|uniref:Uncharacterized protein n=1 Tax=Araneus ventricosus TaxID=182803 RepID=A0A4Y2BFC1_ARAVE|nr:hypothetical protein AVEN_130351-1 [Araneus ventricosus]
MSLKVLSIASYYFFQSFQQHLNSMLENDTSFEAIRESIHFLQLHKIEKLLSQAMCHRSEDVINVRGNVWSIRGFPFKHFQQHVVERCHAAKLLCRVSAGIAAVFPSILGSNTSIVVDSELP